MSNIPNNDDDGLFREIDEELRQEKLKELWDKYGLLAIGAAVALVAAVGGYKYNAWQNLQASQQAGSQLLSADRLVQGKKPAEAETIYQKLAGAGPASYKALTHLHIGSLEASKGKPENALKSFARVSGDSGVDSIFREFTIIQAATLELETATPEAMRKKLSPIADGKGTWRHMARELIGLAEYKAGQIEKAKQTYSRLLTGKDLPDAMKKRALMMQSVLNAATPAKKATKAAAPPSSPKNEKK